MTKWAAKGIDPETQTLINLEWGGFRSASLPRLQEDEALDAEFPNTGQYWFEKMMSGMYLGDVARRVLLSLAQEVQLFGEQVRPAGQHAAYATAVVGCAMSLSRCGAVGCCWRMRCSCRGASGCCCVAAAGWVYMW